ncbi:MAG: TIGR04283 family arsenosugar biosynthesis glycosyltransferase [Thermoflavifilum sp.]|nr:TIGR04283 family arsenosugar biosynthesis glycosyltransferase [Thermoflavifilum sp.]
METNCLNPLISIVIPTYQEAGQIGKLISYLREIIVQEGFEEKAVQIIVCDGGSTDQTLQEAKAAGALTLLSPKKQRAAQMNAGAQLAKGKILYFLHADCYPPTHFLSAIQKAVSAGYLAGCFRMRFDSNNWLLKINQFFTRLPFLFCRGGDQSLFITQELFQKLGGFNESMIIMEDFDIIQRIQRNHKFYIIPDYVKVSARKYTTNPWWKVQFANFIVMRMYLRGASQQKLKDTYQRLLAYRRSEE